MGRQSTWLSLSHAHEPSTGTEVSIFSAFSTVARSVGPPSGNLTLTGMPTPTVALSAGLIVARGVEAGASVLKVPAAFVSRPSAFLAVAA